MTNPTMSRDELLKSLNITHDYSRGRDVELGIKELEAAIHYLTPTPSAELRAIPAAVIEALFAYGNACVEWHKKECRSIPPLISDYAQPILALIQPPQMNGEIVRLARELKALHTKVTETPEEHQKRLHEANGLSAHLAHAILSQPNPQPSGDMRAAFEAEYKRRNPKFGELDLRRTSPDADYSFSYPQELWGYWQAAQGGK